MAGLSRAARPGTEPIISADVKPFHIFNTLTRSVEEFQPLNPPAVTLYSCGPTVYLPQHLGNMRAFLFVDTLKRALNLNGYRVRHVMNVTDVGHMTSDADAGEDKIEKTARAQGKSPREVADFYLESFLRDVDLLRIQRPDVLCRATDHIADMIALVAKILDRGYGYVAPSGVYFDVEKWRGPGKTGRLSRQSLDEQFAGQRLEHSPDKKSPHDFALWVLNQPAHLMQWESPWGRGYPGWHIECSAMSMKYLGETIDLHTGGTDHIAIHHENEIAQSESATGRPFVRYFVHNAFLVEKEGTKISKSAGKFPLLKDLIDSGLSPLAFRILCFGAKYRSEIVFSDEALKAAQKNYEYFAEFARNLADDDAGAPEDSPWAAEYRGRFHDALNDDLNTPRALAAALEMVGEAYRRNDKRVWNTLRALDGVMGLGLEEIRDSSRRGGEKIPPDVQGLIDERQRARAARDFARSDVLRREIEARGFEVRDSRDGTSVYTLRRFPPPPRN
jgi:cysteinyl-tRNA synthetase